MSEIAILGTGAWGTALAIQAARAGTNSFLVGRDPARVATIAVARENPRLPGVTLPARVRLATVLPASAEIILVAVPLQHLRVMAARLPEGAAPLIACCKGLEQGFAALPLEILAETHRGRRCGILTGPQLCRRDRRRAAGGFGRRLGRRHAASAAGRASRDADIPDLRQR